MEVFPSELGVPYIIPHTNHKLKALMVEPGSNGPDASEKGRR